MSSNKRGLMRSLLTSSNTGGGSCGGCGKPKPSEVHQPTPKPKISLHNYQQNTNPRTSLTSSSTTTTTTTTASTDEDFTSTTVSDTETHHHSDRKGATATAAAANNVRVLKPSPKLIDSIAVEKESKDPYKDFGQSMLQMILEREIFSESDLQELLQCFLELNSPCHHRLIVQAFVQICQQAFPKKSSAGGAGEPSRGNHRKSQ